MTTAPAQTTAPDLIGPALDDLSNQYTVIWALASSLLDAAPKCAAVWHENDEARGRYVTLLKLLIDATGSAAIELDRTAAATDESPIATITSITQLSSKTSSLVHAIGDLYDLNARPWNAKEANQPLELVMGDRMDALLALSDDLLARLLDDTRELTDMLETALVNTFTAS